MLIICELKLLASKSSGGGSKKKVPNFSFQQKAVAIGNGPDEYDHTPHQTIAFVSYQYPLLGETLPRCPNPCNPFLHHRHKSTHGAVWPQGEEQARSLDWSALPRHV